MRKRRATGRAALSLGTDDLLRLKILVKREFERQHVREAETGVWCRRMMEEIQAALERLARNGGNW